MGIWQVTGIITISFVAMEFVAWATHKFVMHGFLWQLHRDHHQRDHDHVLERNDSFFLIFALPSIFLFLIGTIRGLGTPWLWIGLGTWHALWPAIGCMMLLFIPWDAWFTHLGIWDFNTDHLAGLELFGLPLEEWLFFICIPYACLFTYYCFRVLGVKDYLGKNTAIFTWAPIAGLLLVNIFFPGKAYTSSAFGGLALWLPPVAALDEAPMARPRLFRPISSCCCLPWSSMILTGSFLEEAVVWYNDGQNLAVRIGTIPVEDIFYGLFMFLMTVTVYEALLKRRKVIGDRTVSAKPVKL
ncbi:MAG: lycopene cyclase domain-containing protein [Flavobacteriales bacterium]|nr:lycopene cyclase domain-containing protein [Flavobacteriales bacterium]